MNCWEIALLILVCAAFVAAVTYLIVRKVQGKSGCDCGGPCDSSPGCACCPKCNRK